MSDIDQRRPAADVGYAFMRAIGDLRSELKVTRDELARCRKAAEEHIKATDNLAEVMLALNEALLSATDRFDVLKGIGGLAGKLLGRRGRA